MSVVSIAILSIIVLLPIAILAMGFIIALGRRPGFRRRKTHGEAYTGRERRCAFRGSCPVGDVCDDPQGCVFGEQQSQYSQMLVLRKGNTKDGTSVK